MMDRSSHLCHAPTPREAMIPFAMAGINMLTACLAAWGFLTPQTRLAAIVLILVGVPTSMALSRRHYHRVLLNLLALGPLLILTWSLVQDLPGMQIDWSRPAESIMNHEVTDQLAALLHILVITAAGRAFLLITTKDLLQTPIPSISILLLATIIPTNGSHPEKDPLTLGCLFLLLATSLGLFSLANSRRWFPKHTPILVQKQLVLRMTQFMLLAIPFVICTGLALQPFNMVNISQRMARHRVPLISLPNNMRRSSAVALQDHLDMGGINWPTGNQLIMTIQVPHRTTLLWRGTTYGAYWHGRWSHAGMSFGTTSNNPLDIHDVRLDPGISAAMAEGLIPLGPAPMTSLQQHVEYHVTTMRAAMPIYGAYQIYQFRTTPGLTPIVDADGGYSIAHGYLFGEQNPTYDVLSIIKPPPDKLRVATDISLDPATRDAYLQMPDAAFRARIRARALAILQEAKLTTATEPYIIAQQFEVYLGKHYQYTLTPTPPPPGVDPILDFLFHQRKGYCVYFSGAMVMLCRSIGIPARMAVGFATGEPELSQKPDAPITYRVTAEHAHAWTEIYLPHYGWYTTDPTASSTEATNIWGATWDALSENFAAIKTGVQQFIRQLHAHRAVQLPLLLGLLALLAGLYKFHHWQRRRLPALPRTPLSDKEATAAVVQAYRHAQRWLELWGVPKQRGLTALEWLAALRSLDQEMAPRLEELSLLYLRARYSNHPLCDSDARHAWLLLQQLRQRYQLAHRHIRTRVAEMTETTPLSK